MVIPLLLLLSLLAPGPPQDDAVQESAREAAARPDAERRAPVRPEVVLELRAQGLTRELLLDPRQARRVRTVLEEALILQQMSQGRSRRAAPSLPPGFVARLPETSPQLPGVQTPLPPAQTHPVLRGLEASTYVKLLVELDLQQTKQFIRLLGIAGVLQVRQEALRTRLAMRRRGGGAGAGLAGALGEAGEDELPGLGLGAAGLQGLGTFFQASDEILLEVQAGAKRKPSPRRARGGRRRHR